MSQEVWFSGGGVLKKHTQTVPLNIQILECRKFVNVNNRKSKQTFSFQDDDVAELALASFIKTLHFDVVGRLGL